MGCMKLVESSVLDLDLDISEYLPFDVNNPNHPDATSRFECCSATPQGTGRRRLQPFLTTTCKARTTCHRSVNCRTHRNMVHLKHVPHEAPTHFAYSNLNFNPVATVMEAAAGLQFDVLMDELIFQPMGLGCSYDVGALKGLKTWPRSTATKADGWPKPINTTA